ncbi:MAG: 8-amino-7-oxononanoate synthase [Candidatus Omnitrophica bacterium]|nr:8-amino-7-oxononanoate synthase [Candidatus Omnitrophota bacterium]
MSASLSRLSHDLEDELKRLEARSQRRQLFAIEEVSGAQVRVEGRWLVCWCTNDYLGLSTHPRLIRAAQEAAAAWGVGARASRLLAGSTRIHVELEHALAEFFGCEAAAMFPSGYLANLGTLAALVGRGDLVLVDRLAHASLIDAARASGAMFRIFRHNDPDDARRWLSRYSHARRKLVVTEGLFSMDGDLGCLGALSHIASECGALLYVDDAHGAFALGATGRGSPELLGISHDSLIYMATLGKALGAQGGFVAGPRSLIETLQNRARTFVFETAPAVPIVAAAHEALRIVREEPILRHRLADNIQASRQLLGGVSGLSASASHHILPIVVGSSRAALDLAGFLSEQGMLAPAIRPPTVSRGTARLRISLTALHTTEQVSRLSRLLRQALALAR